MQQPQESEASLALLTIPQVAACLGVCRAHVYKLIHSGLPTIKLGRLVRIHRQSLESWLKDQEQHTDLP